MKKYILFSIVFAGLFSFESVYSQAAASDETCRQLIRNSYKKIDVSSKKSGNASTYMHYTTKILMWDNTVVPNSETEIKLITSNNQIHFMSKEASLYSDDKDVFLVVHRSKELIRSRAVMTADDGNFFISQASLIKDSLLITSSINLCHEIVSEGGIKYMKVELIPPVKARKLYKIEKVVFLINVKSELIAKIQINYSKESEVKRIDNVYHSLNDNYKEKLETPVYYLFFDKYHKLLPKYNNYSYIDNTI